jgi:hypothetical protein
MKAYFDGISVYGLPDLEIPAGETLGYQHLTERFRNGLSAIANTMIQRASSPHMVNIAGSSMVLHANGSVTLIQTLLEEANKGEIDLAGLETFLSYKTKVVRFFTRHIMVSNMRPTNLIMRPHHDNIPYKKV